MAARHEPQLRPVEAEIWLEGLVLLGGEDHVGGAAAAGGEQSARELPVAEVRGQQHHPASDRERGVQMVLAVGAGYVGAQVGSGPPVEREQIGEEGAEV